MNSKEFYYPVIWDWASINGNYGERSILGTTNTFRMNNSTYKTNKPFEAVNKDRSIIFDFSKGTDLESIVLNDLNAKSTYLPSLTRFQNLKTLDLSYNNFNKGLSNIGKGHSLEYLNLYRNANLVGPLKDLQYCRELKYLNLGYTKVWSVLDGLENLTKLEYFSLELSGYTYNPLNGVFRYMPNLKYLNLCYARVAGELQEQFINCTELEYLNLTANNIYGKIVDLDKCTKLKYLLIDECSFGGNLDNIKDLQELEEISLFADAHADDDERLSDVSALSNLSSLKKLTLGGQHEFGNVLDLENSLETIEYLDLTKCYLDEAPKDIEDMTSLTYLDLEYNSLETDEVDRVLQALVDNGLENGFVNMRDGSNEEPSDDGKANKDTLEDRGWTVQTE